MNSIQANDRYLPLLYRRGRWLVHTVLTSLLAIAVLTACSAAGNELEEASSGEEPTRTPAATATATQQPTPTSTPTPSPITIENTSSVTQVSKLVTGRSYTVNIVSLALSMDGEMLAGGANDGNIYLWSWRSGEIEIVFEGGEYREPLQGVAFSPDGSQLVSGAYFSGVVQLWDRNTGEAFGTFIGHSDKIWSVDYSPLGDRVASSSLDSTVKIWNVTTKRLETTLSELSWGLVSKVVYAPDGRLLAAGDYRGIICLWDLVGNQKVDELSGHTDQISDLEFSEDGQLLASSSFDSHVRLWDIDELQNLGTFDNEGVFAVSVALSPDNNLVAAGGDDNRIRIWDAATGDLLVTLEGHEQSITGLVFSKDGATLISSSYDGTVRLWEAASSG
jgi:WD40 repeat protein